MIHECVKSFIHESSFVGYVYENFEASIKQNMSDKLMFRITYYLLSMMIKILMRYGFEIYF